MDPPSHRAAGENAQEHPPPGIQYSVERINRGKGLIHFAHYTFKNKSVSGTECEKRSYQGKGLIFWVIQAAVAACITQKISLSRTSYLATKLIRIRFFLQSASVLKGTASLNAFPAKSNKVMVNGLVEAMSWLLSTTS